ncbi:MAG: OmpA family protein [Desulfobacterales bacterium]
MLTAFLMMVGCAALPPKSDFTPRDLSPMVNSGEYTAKIDQFFVVMDASSSMNEPYKGSIDTGHPKFIVEKETLNRMARTMPELDITGGLTAFGLNPRLSDDLAMTFYGPEAYSRESFREGIAKVKSAGGTTPMAVGIDEAGLMMKEAQGQTAMIVIGDGEETSYDAVASAKALKAEMGDQLCIYTIWVGSDPKGKELMDGLAEAGGCGFATTADAVMTQDGMANFVEQVFLAQAPPKPVATPPPAAPAPKVTWILSGVNFDLDSAVVRPDAKEVLQRDIAILKENAQINVEIQGHTCDLGDARYNQMLSERRAQAVKDYLVSEGIDASRLTAKGYGEERPRFPNDGEPNRARNRRVEMVPFE